MAKFRPKLCLAGRDVCLVLISPPEIQHTGVLMDEAVGLPGLCLALAAGAVLTGIASALTLPPDGFARNSVGEAIGDAA